MEFVVVIGILLVFAALLIFYIGGGTKKIFKSVGLEGDCAEIGGQKSETGKCPPPDCNTDECKNFFIPKLTDDCGDEKGSTCKCCTGL